MNRFIKYFAVATATALLLCSCGTNAQTTTSGYIENPFKTTTTFEQNGNNDTFAKEAYNEVFDLCQTIFTLNESIDGSIDRVFEYKGGKINIDFDPYFTNESDNMPELMTLGVSVTLNGIHQQISVNGSEPTETYVQEYKFNKSTKSYSQTSMDISFDPIISENDKDEKAVALSVIITLNPHFEVNPRYPAVANTHSRLVAANYLCKIITPITNYSDTKIGIGFESEPITNDVINKYSAIRSEMTYNGTQATLFSDIDSIEIYQKDDGKVEAGMLFTAEEDGKYRIYYILNGLPAKLTDGTDCIEVNAQKGYVYYLPPTEIEGATAYDTLVTIVLKCTDNRDGFLIPNGPYPKVILPRP